MTLATTCEEVVRHFSHRDRGATNGLREMFVKSAVEALDELRLAGNDPVNKWEWPVEEANERLELINVFYDETYKSTVQFIFRKKMVVF
jgi:hypothetical protein